MVALFDLVVALLFDAGAGALRRKPRADGSAECSEKTITGQWKDKATDNLADVSLDSTFFSSSETGAVMVKADVNHDCECHA